MKLVSYISVATLLASNLYAASTQTNPKSAAKTTKQAAPKAVVMPKELPTDKAQISYAIGQQLGQQFAKQGIVLDFDALKRAIQDAMSNKNLMTEEQIRDAIMKLQTQIKARMDKAAEVNLKAGQDFLAKNKLKSGVKVTTSGLQYEVLKAGTGEKPSENSKVTVHYTGTLLDGTKFDSSVDRNKPADFRVNAVIKGWTEALQLMPKNSKWLLTIPSNLAYGERGTGNIPPHSVLQFEVELLDIAKEADKKG